MNDIVKIKCYGQVRQMKRDEAIREFRIASEVCDGHERLRYMNILLDLLSGEMFCDDRDGD